MPIPETVVIGVHVMADDFAATLPPAPRRGGRRSALHRSEVLTLALLSQCACFPSERAFWRFADARWRPLFPTLPSRPEPSLRTKARRGALRNCRSTSARSACCEARHHHLLDGGRAGREPR